MLPHPVIARSRETPSIWLLRDHITPLLGPMHTGGAFALAVSACHPGDGPPPHIHRREDEAFYVLEGEMTFLAGDTLFRAAPGTFVWGPRDLVHQFQCSSSTPAKMLLFVAPTQFLDFAMTLAEPASDFSKPPALSMEKIGRLMAVAPQFGIELKLDHAMPKSLHIAPSPKKRVWALGEDVSYLATSDDTRGQFTFVEINTRPGGGPPAHVHMEQDEAFFVVSGTHDLISDTRTERLGPGDAAFIPRGSRHRYTNTSGSTGKLISLHTPGGIERFFDEIGTPYASGSSPTTSPELSQDQVISLLMRHGMTI